MNASNAAQSAKHRYSVSAVDDVAKLVVRVIFLAKHPLDGRFPRIYARSMDYYLPRRAEAQARSYLAEFPVVAIVGPRQAGKSTLARRILSSEGDSLHLDLELPSDRARLRDAESYLSLHRNELICIDEIQRLPELFPLLRVLVDRDRRGGRFLVLGSASPDLLKQSSESLAGRIAYIHLTPFTLEEVRASASEKEGPTAELPTPLLTHWLRGGFPPSFLARNDAASFRWREQFAQTFLDRDIPALGIAVTRSAMERMWTMLASGSGSLLNKAKLADAIGVSPQTIGRYLDLLEATYMVRLLRPWLANVKKRLVKSPKVYVRDSGILHTLSGIDTPDRLYGHHTFGASWESYAIEQLLAALPDWTSSFYRSSGGAELDLVLERNGRCAAIEMKASTEPRASRGFHEASRDIGATDRFIVAPLVIRHGN